MAVDNTNSKDVLAENQHIESEAAESHEEHASDIHNEEAEKDIFGTVLNKNLGDHGEVGFYDVFHVGLPKIFIDDGFHFYWNKEEMEEAGYFTEVHHEVVRTSDHQPPALDVSITSLVIFQWIAMFLCLVMFKVAGSQYKAAKNYITQGFQTVIEFYVDFIRERVVRPNIGDRLTESLTPYFISLYFFIIIMNLLGLIPGGHSATGNIAVTAGLAVTAFIVINITSIREIGLGKYLAHLTGGAPIWLAPIMIPIEILSMFTKPFALTVRLFANMTAGHIIILCLLGLIFFLKTWVVPPIAVGFSLFIYCLELLVAFIQAYVFTILTAVFVGLAIGDHSHEEHAEHAH